MKNLYPVIYGTECPEALEAQQRLAAWLQGLTPQQRSKLRKEFLEPEKVRTRTLSLKAQAEIEALTGFSLAVQPYTERPDWGLAIRA
ncbi:hypothetical protein GCM10023213_08230 [Prosthecobacter algae]|uniref:Uncharacterized protein n=1 Tax=Prosthecobacter algae TaxID=1144682 RepID=A0ABP9NVQ5_9BACT